jgi:iron complex transport system substrate-binding protein
MSDRRLTGSRLGAPLMMLAIGAIAWSARPAASLEAGQAAASRAVAPTRIVSTSPSITETLFALGLGNRVIAVSQFCRFPPEVLKLPKIGTFLKPDLERIITLKPDLVVVGEQSADLSRRLGAAQVPFIAVPSGRLADVTTSMLRIGAAAGIASHARDVAGGVERRLEGVRQRRGLTVRPKVLLILGRNPETLTGMIAVGRDTYLNDLITIAGGINVLDDPASPQYPSVSLENILHLDPDVIVDMIDMSAAADVRARRAEASRGLWQDFRTISAVRHGRVEAAAVDALVVPGPRVVDAAEWLAGVLRRPERP